MLSAEPALVRTSLVDLATRIYGSPGIAQSMWKIVEGSRRLNDDTHNQAIFSTVLMSRIINDTDLRVPRELMMSLYPLGQATLTLTCTRPYRAGFYLWKLWGLLASGLPWVMN